MSEAIIATEVEATGHPAFLEREDCTLAAWYRSVYAPRTEGAYDSHHRTAGIAGRTRRRGGRVAACGARAGQIRCASAEICAPCRPDIYQSICNDRQYHSLPCTYDLGPALRY